MHDFTLYIMAYKHEMLILYLGDVTGMYWHSSSCVSLPVAFSFFLSLLPSLSPPPHANETTSDGAANISSNHFTNTNKLFPPDGKSAFLSSGLLQATVKERKTFEALAPKSLKQTLFMCQHISWCLIRNCHFILLNYSFIIIIQLSWSLSKSNFYCHVYLRNL